MSQGDLQVPRSQCNERWRDSEYDTQRDKLAWTVEHWSGHGSGGDAYLERGRQELKLEQYAPLPTK